MNKETIVEKYLQFVNEREINANDVLLSAGGACVMFGIRNETSDLDIDVPEHIFLDILVEGYPQKEFQGTKYVQYTDDIAVHLSTSIIPSILIDGVWVWQTEYILAQKLKMNRNKDQSDIEGLKKILL